MDSINKTHVDAAILQGQTATAIKMLLALYRANSPSEYDNIVLQSARWHGLERDRQSGVISFDNAQMMTAQINSVLRHFTSKIERNWAAEFDLSSAPKPTPTQNTAQAEPEPQKSAAKKKVILCLSANPSNSERLMTGVEMKFIRNSLEYGRDHYDLETRSAVSVDEFIAEVTRLKPTIIHFTGHGTETGEIILHDPNQRGQNVSAKSLGAFFEIANQIAPIECIVLNACFSHVQAKIIAEHIPHVMGMTNKVQDKAAAEFAKVLYQQIASGSDYDIAFAVAKTSLDMKGFTNHDLPILIQN